MAAISYVIDWRMYIYIAKNIKELYIKLYI